MKDNETVYPGTEIAEEEEYLPGNNTFIKDGHIYSAGIGKKEVNLKSRKISIKSNKKIIMPRKGDLVYGKVVNIKDTFAIIELLAINNSKERQFFKFSSALLPVSNISTSFIDNIRDVLKKGDLVKAQIDHIDKFGIKVSMKGRDLGVILGHCKECKAPLVLSNRILKCKKCLADAQRKTASDSYILKI